MKRLFDLYGPSCLPAIFLPSRAAASPTATESATIGGKKITIVYCSPRVNGREGHIFTKDGLIKQTHKSYPVWRGGPMRPLRWTPTPT